MFVTKHDIEYKYGWNNKLLKIPAGSAAIKASNLPKKEGKTQFWLKVQVSVLSHG